MSFLTGKKCPRKCADCRSPRPKKFMCIESIPDNSGMKYFQEPGNTGTSRNTPQKARNTPRKQGTPSKKLGTPPFKIPRKAQNCYEKLYCVTSVTF